MFRLGCQQVFSIKPSLILRSAIRHINVQGFFSMRDIGLKRDLVWKLKCFQKKEIFPLLSSKVLGPLPRCSMTRLCKKPFPEAWNVTQATSQTSANLAGWLQDTYRKRTTAFSMERRRTWVECFVKRTTRHSKSMMCWFYRPFPRRHQCSRRKILPWKVWIFLFYRCYKWLDVYRCIPL